MLNIQTNGQSAQYPTASQHSEEPARRYDRFSVLIGGHDQSGLEQLNLVVGQIADVDVEVKYLASKQADPLQGVDQLPGLLLYWVGANWREELGALARRPPAQRPKLIVIGSTAEQEVMRLAMKAGAIDYLRPRFDAGELQEAIREIMETDRRSAGHRPSALHTVINAKGGAGASLLACNLAHTLSQGHENRVALIDGDLQFGALCHYLDMEPKYGLREALENAWDLDEAALEGYMQKHVSGLHLLDVQHVRRVPGLSIDPQQMDMLLDVMMHRYQHVVFDLPRRFDAISNVVLDRAATVLVVLQQSLAHLRDAKRLLDILRTERGVSEDRIRIVINRYDKRSELQREDIAKVLGHPIGAVVPNAYRQVRRAVDEGMPLTQISRRASITRAIAEMGAGLLLEETASRPGQPRLGGLMQKMRRT